MTHLLVTEKPGEVLKFYLFTNECETLCFLYCFCAGSIVAFDTQAGSAEKYQAFNIDMQADSSNITDRAGT